MIELTDVEAAAGLLPGGYGAVAFLSDDDLSNTPRVRWRVRDLLPATGVAAIYGASGSGKTFLALDLARAIAEGSIWFGHRVESAHVVYVPVEAPDDVADRVTAHRLHKKELTGVRPTLKRFHVLHALEGAAAINLTDPGHVAARGQSIADAYGPGTVVVVDTLHRAAPNIDENSASDMSSVIEGAHQLQRRVGGLVILVHHTGKDAGRGMRGHSSLYASMDAVIEVSADNGGSRRFTLTKARRGASGAAQAFKLWPVVLGPDEYGEPITSCAVEGDKDAPTATPTAKGPAGENQKAVLSAIKAALGENQAQQVDGRSVLAWPVAFDVAFSALAAEGKPRAKERAGEALQALQKAGFLQVEGSSLKKAQQVVWV